MAYQRLPTALMGLGLLFGGIMIVELAATARSPIPFSIPVVANFVSSLPFVAGLIAGGYWLRTSDLSLARYPRIAASVLVGMGFFFLFALLAAIGQPDWLGRIAILRWGAAIGAGIGLLVGLTGGRAIDRAVVVERERMRSEELQRANERLEEFARTIAHDLRNPLNVASGNIDMARDESDDDRLVATAAALDRMEAIISGTLTLARSGTVIDAPESVSLAEVAHRAWKTVETKQATIEIEAEFHIAADADRLQQLFENLFRNAVEHAGPAVTVRVGALPEGFYVEDDGPGIPEDHRESVFDAGFTTIPDGTGFGLSIVKQIADAHGWGISAGDGTDGGARFEITGVEMDASAPDPAAATA